jgi:8-hydroxy-5-deazaflavin:NADPH oxidoreductase
MKIGVLGTGVVGQAIARKLVALGHDVVMGARTAANKKAQAFAGATAGRAGSFADAAAHGEIIFHCTLGDAAVEVLTQAGAENLKGKVVVDISNPLDSASGFPPSLSITNTDSLGELLQRTFPEARIVKSLNTVTASIMVDPAKLPGAHTVFVSGNDAAAKAEVTELLKSFGWQSILDLGDITTARGTEQYVALWIRLYMALGKSEFNVALVKGE